MNNKLINSALLIVSALAMSFIISCNGNNGNNPESSNSKQLTEFYFESPPSTGIIDESAKTVSVTVPFGTEVTSLIALFSTTGVKTTINDVEQTSGVTENDFSNPVTYTVTAEDNSNAQYEVTVIIAESDAKDITSFAIVGQVSSDINGTDITVNMPSGTDISSLTTEITHTGVDINPASGEVQDFSSPVIYTVTADDGSTKEYTVTVSVPEEETMVFDFMTDGDTLVRDAGSDWYFDGGYTGNYSPGYYMSQTSIAAPWLFTGNFSVEFEFYLKVLSDEYIYRYALRLVDPNWENNSNRRFFDMTAYYTAFPESNESGTPTYYQTSQGNGSYTYNEYDGNIPGVKNGVNTCIMVKEGNDISISMNGTHVRTVTIDASNLPSVGYSPFIHGHNSWDQADSNFYLRKVTVVYISNEIVYHNWNE